MVQPDPPAPADGDAGPGTTASPAPSAPSEASARERDRIVVIGASAGGVEALLRVVRNLPPTFAAPILVVLHVPASPFSRLPEILGRAGALIAHHAVHGEAIELAHVCIAPPDHHLIVTDHRIALVEGPRENGVRPAIDPLFRSAARVFGSNAVGVILSGTLDDGTAGAAAIRAAGGTVIAQEPTDAICPGMPLSAIESAGADHVASADAIGDLLNEMVGRSTEPREMPPRPRPRKSEPTDLVCPECGGVLRDFEENGVVRFHCRVGHNYSPESLFEAHDARLEAGLWAAIRALEESASMSRRLSQSAYARGATATASRFESRERDAAERADLIRSAILTLSDLEDTPTLAEAQPVATEDDRRRAELEIDDVTPQPEGDVAPEPEAV